MASNRGTTGSLAFLMAVTAGLLDTGTAAAQPASSGDAIAVNQKYTAPASDEDGKARGISGIACLGKSGDKERECLVVNDEETFAEVAILAGKTMQPTGKVVPVVEKGEAGKGIVGKQRKADCGDDGKFSELDGEGIAVTPDYVYLISSHSCSGGGKYKPSSYLISRYKLEIPTSFLSRTPRVVERTWRGGDMLFFSAAGAAYGKSKTEGTNIEGVAVVGEHLYAGLRTPADGTSAFLVRAPVNALFAANKEAAASDKDVLAKELVETRSLALGANTGIRDLASLADGSLLILSGPTIEQADVEYQIWHLPNPVWTAKPTAKAIVKTAAVARKPKEVPKAEAMTVLEQDGNRAVVIVAYDNVDEGAPAMHAITIGP